MSFRQIIFTVIAGLWLLGLLLSQGQGKNYDDTPPECIERPYGCFNEYNRDYVNEDDFEYEEGITTP